MIYGVGINDLKSWSTRNDSYECRVYTLWTNMLKRCYSGKNPTYSDCEVCEEWLKLSNFARDIPSLPGYDYWRENPGQYISLDKDIRSQGEKIYCPENCSFVTREENTREMTQRVNIGDPIICTHADGEEVYYSSLSKAEEDGYNKGGIHQCLMGKINKHHGCTWRYA